MEEARPLCNGAEEDPARPREVEVAKERRPEPRGRRLLLAACVAAAALALLGLAAFAGPATRRRRAWLSQAIVKVAYTVRGALHFGHPHEAEEVDERVGYIVSQAQWEQARAKAERTVSRLRLEEMHGLLHGMWARGPGYYVGNVDPIPSLGIPPLKMQDASSGFRAMNPHEYGTTTQWPCMLAMASTWDEALTGTVAAAIAREFVGKGANVLLGPSVNVHRTAFGGRNFEYLSGEDPYLGARLTRAYVRGVQGEGVMAVVKHFAFNEQETARGHESSDVGARTAWELYYPPFEAAVEAGAAAVMCSYNRVNGTAACENRELLLRDLKGAMNFRGFVMSDWTATHSTGAIERGLDMEQPHGRWFADAKLSTNASAEAVREAAVRILTSIYRLGLDQAGGCVPPCLKEHRSNQRTRAHLELASLAATRSVTLLQNDGVLPLDAARVRTLAVLGRAANASDVAKEWVASPYAGGGSGHVPSLHVVRPLAAIEKRARVAGMRVLYHNGRDLEAAREVAREADVVFVVASALSKEGDDRKSLDLAWGADELISGVAGLRPTVVLMQTPGAVLTPWRNETAAVANLFYGGERTGEAWASVIFGDASPTGRLPVAFPATKADAIEPTRGHSATEYYAVPYVEGRLTSYRSHVAKAAYPFGHGLTYTHFSYGQPRVLWGEDCPVAACLLLTVSNTGRRAGTEVVQTYLRFSPAVGEPRFVLRGFRRTQLLQPGGQQELLFPFSTRDLSEYNPGSGWVRSHSCEVHVGASSADIRHVVELPASYAARVSCRSAAWHFVIAFLALLMYW